MPGRGGLGRGPNNDDMVQYDRWIKIGEVLKIGGWMKETYSKYAVFERIDSQTGMRQYREVFMASCTDRFELKPQVEIKHSVFATVKSFPIQS